MLVLISTLVSGMEKRAEAREVVVHGIANTPTLRNFQEVLASKASDYVVNFGNSVIVATASTAIVIVCAFLAAYSLFRTPWPRAVTLITLIWAMVFQMVPTVTLAGACSAVTSGVNPAVRTTATRRRMARRNIWFEYMSDL